MGWEAFFTLQTLIHVAVVLSMLNFTLITADRLIAVKWPFFYEDRIHIKQSVIAISRMGNYPSTCNSHNHTFQCLASSHFEIFRKRYIYCYSYNRFYYALNNKFFRFCKGETPIKSNWENHFWYSGSFIRA